MTSKKLYLAKWLENIKRRNWTFLLCAVTLLLIQPVQAAINLTSCHNRMQDELIGMSSFDLAVWRQSLQETFLRMTGFSVEIFLAVCGFAVLFAVQGFSFLYSRKKMDFYMSVPVSGPKRYVMIMGNGIVVFGTCYLICTVLNMLICVGFGLFTFEIFLQLLLSYFVMMLTFTAIYQVALAAVMLTGNVLTALLGCGVFFFYEPLVRLVVNQLKSSFFVTYCGWESSQFMDQVYLTPAANVYQFLENTWYGGTKLQGAPYGDAVSVFAAVSIQILVMLVSILLWGAAAYILFRKRKTESYGSAIAFGGAKGVIRFFLLIPCSVVTGLLASIWAGDSLLFLWTGALVGLLLGHAVIQLIYERDLRAIGRRFWSLGASGAAAAAVLAVFCFDLTGYDQYVPELEDVEAVSVTVEHDYSGLGRLYKTPFNGSRRDVENALLTELNSGDAETICAVLRMASDYVEHLKTEGDEYGYRNSDETEDFHCWIVRYELKSGREVYRRFYSDAARLTDEIDTVMRDEAYQNIRCQLFDPAFGESLDQMKIVYSTGVMEYLYTMDKEALYQAFAEEMRSYDYSLLCAELPKGVIRFTIPDQENPNSNLCTWDFPVYPSFEKTLALIGENGIPAWEENALQPEDVESISLDYYYYEEEESYQADNSVIREQVKAVKEQTISVEITKSDEISRLLEALYPQRLADVMDSTIHFRGSRAFDSDFDITVHLSESGRQKRMDTPYMMILEDEIPEFVIKKLNDAAKKE